MIHGQSGVTITFCPLISGCGSHFVDWDLSHHCLFPMLILITFTASEQTGAWKPVRLTLHYVMSSFVSGCFVFNPEGVLGLIRWPFCIQCMQKGVCFSLAYQQVLAFKAGSLYWVLGQKKKQLSAISQRDLSETALLMPGVFWCPGPSDPASLTNLGLV